MQTVVGQATLRQAIFKQTELVQIGIREQHSRQAVLERQYSDWQGKNSKDLLVHGSHGVTNRG
jgi:bisphosphoglycerate-dependent phosphoglycerate mutase